MGKQKLHSGNTEEVLLTITVGQDPVKGMIPIMVFVLKMLHMRDRHAYERFSSALFLMPYFCLHMVGSLKIVLLLSVHPFAGN